MRIEVRDAHIDKNKVLHIWGPSIKDLRRCRDSREREDRIPWKYFAFDTREPKALKYVVWLLHDQVVTKTCKTYGEAVQAIVGTGIDIRSEYLTSGCEGMGE